ncbi:hypothetical protein HON36_02550 [Candidatus Parcubacteria bacterium]|jgi:hypothetical protein|nr:hypothetical protein [Candidatus Parcubacteria bacterium]
MKVLCQEVKEDFENIVNQHNNFCDKLLAKDIWGARDIGQNIEFLFKNLKKELAGIGVDMLVALLIRAKIIVNKGEVMKNIFIKDGGVFIKHSLDFTDKKVDWDIDKLPPNLTIRGDLNLWNDKKILRLPVGLIVGGDLKLGSTKNLDTLPDDLIVKGALISENIYVLDKAIELYRKGQIKKINPGQIRWAKYNS